MKKIWWFLLCLFVIVLAIVFHAWWLPSLAKFLDVGTAPRQADYVMVMGGGVRNRPFTAAALVKKDWCKRVLVSEITSSPGSENLLAPEHELTTAVLQKLGVPRDRIVILRGNHAATFHEIESLGQLLAREPGAQVIIVTDALHTRRTRWSVRRILGKEADRVSFVSAPTDEYSAERWWQNADGFFMVTSEYLKLLFYSFRYGWGVPVTAGAAIFIVALIACRRFRRVPVASG
ncbi:MAG: YdcF family protein [Thermogutta sp.]